jgi:hypothetical protein
MNEHEEQFIAAFISKEKQGRYANAFNARQPGPRNPEYGTLSCHSVFLFVSFSGQQNRRLVARLPLTMLAYFAPESRPVWYLPEARQPKQSLKQPATTTAVVINVAQAYSRASLERRPAERFRHTSGATQTRLTLRPGCNARWLVPDTMTGGQPRAYGRLKQNGWPAEVGQCTPGTWLLAVLRYCIRDATSS